MYAAGSHFLRLVAKIWVTAAANGNTQTVKPENTLFASCPSLITRFCKLPTVRAKLKTNCKQPPGHQISAFKPSSPKVKVCSLQSESLFLGAYTYNQWYSQTYKGCWDRYLQTYKRCKIEKYANHICHSWCVLPCFLSRFVQISNVFYRVLVCFMVFYCVFSVF